MKTKMVILVLLVLGILAVSTAGAFTITMANPSGIAERDFAVYYFNGSMMGLYNSTSVIDVVPSNGDLIIAMKPMQTNPMEDPGAWLMNDSIPFIQTNVTYIIIMIGLIGLFWLGRK